MTSDLEQTFAFVLRCLGGDLPAPVAEYRFAAPRKYRFDFAYPDQRLAIELEGGVYSGGRHTRGAGYAGDCAKYNLATLSGWRVLRYTGKQLRDDPAKVIAEIRTALCR